MLIKLFVYVSGFYTNHSLRATCATRLFRSGVDEQLIARTGHRSNAIRNYKRICTEQEADISKIVQGSKQRKRSEAAPAATVSTNPDPDASNTSSTVIHSGGVDISVNVTVKK